MPQPVERNDFPRTCGPSSRSKIAASHGPPLALRSQAMQQSGFAACWFTDKAAMGATL
jgi:hypothetical protein